LVQTNNL